MELSWSTFFLEIVNFLVLVWILKHFVYQPILTIVEQRRQNIAETIASAESTQSGAELLQQQYETRLSTWEQEKRRAEESLQREIQEKRADLLEKLNEDLKREREKARVVEQRHLTDLQQEYWANAFGQGARFAARLLTRVASPELEDKLVELLLEQLSTLTDEKKSALRGACEPPPESIEIASAFPLDDGQRQHITDALLNVCPASIPVRYEVDDALLSGLRITLGHRVLRFNLQDELEDFAALGRK